MRPTRTSSRTSTAMSASGKTGAHGAAKGSAVTKSNKPTTKKSGASAPLVSKGSKRKVASKAGARKRAKQNDSEDDDEEVAEESSEDADHEDYQENDDDDDGDQDSDADDFEDNSYGYKPKPKPTPKSRTPKASSSSAAKSKETKKSPKKPTNPDLQPVPSRTFETSTLVIPHPKNGPVADAVQPETLELMRDLKLNNNKEFMEMNRARYEQAKADFMDFIRMVKEGLLEADRDVMDVEPKDCMMRINRDIRFSNDKSPYKSQLACFFSRGGKKSIAAGYYFGVSSGGETFAGCGVWDPSGPVLFRIRQGIVNHSDRFKAILETDAIKKMTGKTGVDVLRPGSSQLKTGPAGFDKDHPMIEYLKRKCFAVGRSFTDKEVVSEGFLEEVLQTFDASVDLVHILNEWIG
ncbi:hypothetical protein BGZ58_007985 [Dissophora ornata]|nr:hypothetical protein BGZ58_007985 [Dissophora ornata]